MSCPFALVDLTLTPDPGYLTRGETGRRGTERVEGATSRRGAPEGDGKRGRDGRHVYRVITRVQECTDRGGLSPGKCKREGRMGVGSCVLTHSP